MKRDLSLQEIAGKGIKPMQLTLCVMAAAFCVVAFVFGLIFVAALLTY